MSIFSPYASTGNPVSVSASIEPVDPQSIIYYSGLNVPEPQGALSSSPLEQYTISWQPNENAVSYNVYASLNPFFQFSGNTLANKLNTIPIPSSVNSLVWIPPTLPLTLEFQFWVTMVDKNGKESLLFNDPATIENKLTFVNNPITPTAETFPVTDAINAQMAYMLEEIRRRHQFMLQNDGEPAYIYLRRWGANKPFGTPCSCVDDVVGIDDSDYHGSEKCAECFGTGIKGGFFPKIPIVIRYNNIPVRSFQNGQYGITLEHAFDSWTLWAPRLRHRDLLVRANTGERFELSEVGESSWRGLRLQQKLKFAAIPQTDIRQQVSDQTIEKAVSLDKVASFQRIGWKIFN
jgi:hypothetical protein